MTELTQRIVNLQKERGYNDHQLEVGANLPVSSIQAWTKGRKRKDGKIVQTNPSAESIVKIARFFGVSTDYLLCLTEDKTPHYSPTQTALPATKQETSVGFPEQYKSLLTDEKYIDITKLYYNIDEMKRAVLFGTVLGCLQTLKVNTKEILGY